MQITILIWPIAPFVAAVLQTALLAQRAQRAQLLQFKPEQTLA